MRRQIMGEGKRRGVKRQYGKKGVSRKKRGESVDRVLETREQGWMRRGTVIKGEECIGTLKLLDEIWFK